MIKKGSQKKKSANGRSDGGVSKRDLHSFPHGTELAMTSMGLAHWSEIFCPSYQGMCGCGSTSNSRPLLAWRMSDLVDKVVTQYVLAATVFIFCTSEQGIRTVSDSNPFVWWWFGKRWGWMVGDVVLLVHLRRGSPRDKTGFAMSFS